MRPVLLLVPDRDRVPERALRQVELRAAGAVDAATGYSSVIVLNDGRAGTVQRLRQALALRERCPDLHVGVLTWLDTPSADLHRAEAFSVALTEPGAALRVELKEILSVEYQA